MTIKSVMRKYFHSGNVSVDGLRGCGKDMLFANVIARDKRPYISNVNYKISKKGFWGKRRARSCVWLRLDFDKLNVKNNYDNLVRGDIVPYEYPYPEKVDIYLSDAGVYFPAQNCNQLNRQYDTMPYFQALSRQLGECNFHTNCQNLNRVWDKIREQSDIYIKCNWCRVLFGRIVVQKVTFYDKYESCLNRVQPFRSIPTWGKDRKNTRLKNDELQRAFLEKNGMVKSRILIYRNLSQYDTRLFKSILRGCDDEVEKEENDS